MMRVLRTEYRFRFFVQNEIQIPSDEGSESMGKSLWEFCEESGREELLQQWDAKKHGVKMPDKMHFGGMMPCRNLCMTSVSQIEKKRC